MPETVLLLSQEIYCYGSLKMVLLFGKKKIYVLKKERKKESLSAFRLTEMAV